MESRFVATTRTGNAVTVTVSDGDEPAITSDETSGAMWTSWRPGHGMLTWSRVDGSAALLVDGREVPGATTSPALFLGPGLPHYALWSPARPAPRLCRARRAIAGA